MNAACDLAVQDIGNGLGASLRGIDCIAGEMTQQAFGRLFGAGGQLVSALTILLTIFIALFGFALLTGRANVSIRSLVPRMVLLGLVLTFATSWVAFQVVFPNLLIGAPDQIAGILTGSQGSATQLFADKIDIVFATVAEVASGQGAQGGQEAAGTFSPPSLLWLGAILFLIGTVGVLVTTRIALAVLIALGPIFVVMALFNGTRGLFVGWLKGLILLALAPLLAVLSGSLILEMTVPILNSLSPIPGEIDPRAAFAFFMVGFVHVSLMILAMKTASTMVAGWRVFGLADRTDSNGASAGQGAQPIAPRTPYPQSGSAGMAAPPSSAPRRTAMPGMNVMIPANDVHGAPPAGTREARIHVTGSAQPAQPDNSSPLSRTRGIGSRFRAAPARSPEKLK